MELGLTGTNRDMLARTLAQKKMPKLSVESLLLVITDSGKSFFDYILAVGVLLFLICSIGVALAGMAMLLERISGKKK